MSAGLVSMTGVKLELSGTPDKLNSVRLSAGTWDGMATE